MPVMPTAYQAIPFPFFHLFLNGQTIFPGIRFPAILQTPRFFPGGCSMIISSGHFFILQSDIPAIVISPHLVT